MKSAILIGPNYPPESNAAAKRMSALAEFLVGRGWKIEVVTLLPHYPQNRIYEGYDIVSPARSVENGVDVVRIRPWIVPRDDLALRLLSETLFSVQALSHVLKRRVDLIFASSPYMFLGPAGLLGSRLRGARFAWELRDLTWEYAKATGRRRYGMDVAFERLMRSVAKRADALITATHGQLPYFHERPERSVVVPNGLSDALIDRLAPAQESAAPPIRAVTVVYAGLLGYPQALSTLVRAAALLPSLRFVFVGDGPERAALQAESEELDARNVHFAGYKPFEALEGYYRCADILVAHLRDSPAFRVAQPSKLWEYMATGKPVVFAGRGEAADILRKHHVGIVVDPEDPPALAEALRTLAVDAQARAQLGRRGRAFVLEHRRRTALLGRLSALLDELAE